MTKVEEEDKGGANVGQINSHIASSALFADKEAVRCDGGERRND